MPAIKVTRHGVFRGIKKPPFRMWLDEQPRSGLTYKKELPRRDEKGWTTEDFVFEAINRDVDVRFGTAYTWTHGTMPKWMALQALSKAFPGIRFGKSINKKED